MERSGDRRDTGGGEEAYPIEVEVCLGRQRTVIETFEGLHGVVTDKSGGYYLFFNRDSRLNSNSAYAQYYLAGSYVPLRSAALWIRR